MVLDRSKLHAVVLILWKLQIYVTKSDRILQPGQLHML
jgi:hypothetical protein